MTAVLHIQVRAQALRNENKNPMAVHRVDEFQARSAIALTYGMITMIDDAIGRVLKRLEAPEGGLFVPPAVYEGIVGVEESGGVGSGLRRSARRRSSRTPRCPSWASLA